MTYRQCGIWLKERQLVSLGIFRGLVNDAEETPPHQDQVVGQACGKRLIESCRTFFGDSLPVACRSCPGPKQ